MTSNMQAMQIIRLLYILVLVEDNESYFCASFTTLIDLVLKTRLNNRYLSSSMSMLLAFKSNQLKRWHS